MLMLLKKETRLNNFYTCLVFKNLQIYIPLKTFDSSCLLSKCCLCHLQGGQCGWEGWRGWGCQLRRFILTTRCCCWEKPPRESMCWWRGPRTFSLSQDTEDEPLLWWRVTFWNRSWMTLYLGNVPWWKKSSCWLLSGRAFSLLKVK